MSSPVPVFTNLTASVPLNATGATGTADIPDDMWASWARIDPSTGSVIHIPVVGWSYTSISPNDVPAFFFPHGSTSVSEDLIANAGTHPPTTGGLISQTPPADVTSQTVTVQLIGNLGATTVTGLSMWFFMRPPPVTDVSGPSAADVDSLFVTESAIVTIGTFHGRSWAQVIG